jgi:glycerol uptake facilitator protein
MLAALSHGLALCIIVNTLGRASGAHVNPAVTLALASIGRFSWAQVPGYIIAQFAGAFVAALAIVGVFGTKAITLAAAGAPSLPHGVSGVQGLLAEILGTFILVLGVVAMAADTRITLPEGWAGFIIGLALLSGIFVAGTTSGAGLNPALAISPYLVDGLFNKGAPITPQDIPVYAFGPIIGGVIAAIVYAFIAQMRVGPVSRTGEVTSRLPGGR